MQACCNRTPVSRRRGWVSRARSVATMPHDLDKPAPDVRVVCLPSSDGEFARVVGESLASGRVATIAELEDRVRPSYPNVRILRSELTGEPLPTWYVYRDGGFRPSGTDS